MYGMRLWSFIRYTLRQDDVCKYGERIHSFQDIKQDYTCFMFPEGVTSNGKSILPFEINDKELHEFLTSEGGEGDSRLQGGIRTMVQWCQIKHIPSSLTVPIPRTALEFLKVLLYINNPQSKCKILSLPASANSAADTVEDGRTALNSGRAGVARTLGAAQKKRFLSEWLGCTGGR